MKTKIFLSLLVMAALCFVPSCSDDDDVVENTNQQTDNPNQNTGDENTGDENTGENTPDDEDSPLENGLIVIEDGATFTGYEAHTEETMRPVNPVFSVTEDDMTETLSVSDVPEAILAEHSGHTLAWLRSLSADYERGDSPTTLTVSKTDAGRIQFKAKADRWSLDADSENWISLAVDNTPSTIVKATTDKSVYYIDNGATSEYYTETQMPNWGAGDYGGNFDRYGYDDVVCGWQVHGWSGMFSADGTQWDFTVSFYNIASGTDFTFRSGDLSPAEAMAGHYYGTLTFDNQWLSTVTTYQGTNSNTVGDPTGGAGKGDMYALIKPDDNGDIRFDITGFDIGKNVFGNLNITGIKDVTDHENWGYDFELDDFEVEQPINGVWATVTGSLEGEMTFDGKLTVIIKATYPVIGDVTLTYEAEYTDWLGWNTYYGAQSRRPW